MNSATRLHPGDIVEVKAPEEIVQTLDASGALDHLPFMPEMAEFCGQQFRVFRLVVKTCSSERLHDFLARSLAPQSNRFKSGV
jgi:hypothetical protein